METGGSWIAHTDEPRWFKDHTKEAYGFIGGTVNMTCSAVAEPGADFIWIKDNRTLHPSDDVQIFNSDHHSSLQLYIYDESVFGDYECRATNMLGTMARVIVLEQATKPAAPTFKIKVSLRVNCLRRRAASFLVCFINVPFHFFPPSPTHTMKHVGLSIKKEKKCL